MRHSWKKDNPEKGLSTCDNCGLQVKNYKIKKGKLPRCEAILPVLDKPKVDCERHDMAAIAGARQCWNCGIFYSPAELEAGRIKRERLMRIQAEKERQDSIAAQNPPVISI